MTTVGGLPLFVGPTSLAGAELTAGEHIPARVLRMLSNGDVLVAFGQNRAAVSTSEPLRPGDHVELEVVTGGPKPELRIVTDLPEAGLPLAAGQRLTGRAVEMLLNGQVVIALGQNRVAVSTSDVLQPGDHVELEVLTGGPKPELRIVTDLPDEGPPLAAGQRLTGRVTETLPNGEVLVTFGQNRVAVSPSDPLHRGDQVELEVVTGGPEPELRLVRDTLAAAWPPAAALPVAARALEILPPNAAASELDLSPAAVPTSNPLQPGVGVGVDVVMPTVEPGLPVVKDDTAGSQPAEEPPRSSDPQRVAVHLGARDLEVIIRALADVSPSGIPIAQAGEEFLRAANGIALPPAVSEQIHRLYAPLDAARPTEELAAMIRTFIAQSGLFTENHLREALKKGAVTLATDEDHHAAADVRLLLGEVTAASTPVPDAVRSFGEALLQQQLVVVERQAATGVGHIEIPFMFGGERVEVTFEWDGQADRESQPGDQQEGRQRTVSLGVFVHLKVLGAIETRVEWQPGSLNITFLVEREATRAIVDAALAGFLEHLSLADCPPVTSNVRLKSDHPSKAPPSVSTSIPGGAIFDVRV
jgi:hypothetical protein